MIPEFVTTRLRCDECGKFISYLDLEKGLACRHLISPDSEYTIETWETLCKEHNNDTTIRS